MLKQASMACVPSSPSSSPSGSASSAPSASPSIDELEAAAKYAALASSAVDGLAAHALGGLDVAAFSKSLGELRVAITELAGPFPQASTTDIAFAFDAVQAAMD